MFWRPPSEEIAEVRGDVGLGAGLINFSASVYVCSFAYNT